MAISEIAVSLVLASEASSLGVLFELTVLRATACPAAAAPAADASGSTFGVKCCNFPECNGAGFAAYDIARRRIGCFLLHANRGHEPKPRREKGGRGFSLRETAPPS